VATRYKNPGVQHTLCSIDPGKRACGVAIWTVGEKSSLVWCGLIKQRDGDPLLLARKILKKTNGFCVYFLEDPQFYPHKRKAHGDLRSLQKVVKFLEMEGARPMVKVKPVGWKGNLPKPVHHKRILQHLNQKEKKLVPEDHNVRDAVALGLFAIGRTGKGGTVRDKERGN